MSDEIEVSYTVKELLKQLSDRIDAFMGLVSTKADQSSVAHAHDRIDKVEGRVVTLEHSFDAKEKHSQWRQEFRRWVVPTLLSAGTIVVLILQVFHP